MTRTIADQYLAQNAGRRYPFKDDTGLPDWLPDSGVLDFRCTLYGVGAGTAPEARLVNVAHTGDGNVRFTVDLSAGGVVVDTIRFLVPSGMAGAPYTAYASGDRSTGALTVTAAAIPPNTGVPPYDAEVEYLESTGGQQIQTNWTPNLTTNLNAVGRCAFATTSRGMLFSAYANSATKNFAVELYQNMRFRVYAGQDVALLNCIDTLNELFDYTIEYTANDGKCVVVANGLENTGSVRADARIVNTLPARFGADYRELYRYGVYGQCKVFNSDLVLDFIPVRFTNELGQSEGAMYDRVTNQLFRNAGTGAFLYGDDVAPAPGAGEYPVDIPFAATTVVCDSLKVMSLQSAHDAADARDVSDPAGLDPVARLTGEVVLAEGRNAEPYLDGSRLRLDIRKGAGLGENCQAMASSQTCDNVLFAINGERPGSDGDIRIAGENGVSVTARPGEHAITIKLDDAARDRLAKECASACNGG